MNSYLKAGLTAVALFTASSVFTVQADSYVNSQNTFKKHTTQKVHVTKRKSNRVVVSPARAGKRQNFGVHVRDTSREGYGPGR